jgi:hypothetical protein
LLYPPPLPFQAISDLVPDVLISVVPPQATTLDKLAGKDTVPPSLPSSPEATSTVHVDRNCATKRSKAVTVARVSADSGTPQDTDTTVLAAQASARAL